MLNHEFHGNDSDALDSEELKRAALDMCQPPVLVPYFLTFPDKKENAISYSWFGAFVMLRSRNIWKRPFSVLNEQEDGPHWRSMNGIFRINFFSGVRRTMLIVFDLREWLSNKRLVLESLFLPPVIRPLSWYWTWCNFRSDFPVLLSSMCFIFFMQMAQHHLLSPTEIQIFT